MGHEAVADDDVTGFGEIDGVAESQGGGAVGGDELASWGRG